MPVKIAAPGGNICDHPGQSVGLELNVSRFTGPAVLMRDPENVYNTVMVGPNNVVHLSLALGDGSNV
jgi:hypothetical protein